MNKKLYWGFTPLILLIIGAFVFLIVKNQVEIRQLEREDATFQKQLQQQNAPQVPEGEHPTQGHFHDDDTFHAAETPDPIEPDEARDSEPEPSRDFTPTQVQIPEGITDPDVIAAWERVEYIANNIWEWGGVPSPETEELIAQLMPPPDGFSGPTGHGDAEATIDLLGSLDRNDPRTAEVMATYNCEGLIGGLGPEIGLGNMGPPAVPYLIPYMLDMELMPALRSRAIAALGRIAEKHSEDLGGIVDHILIPRWETILAEEKPDYDERYEARAALARLK